MFRLALLCAVVLVVCPLFIEDEEDDADSEENTEARKKKERRRKLRKEPLTIPKFLMKKSYNVYVWNHFLMMESMNNVFNAIILATTVDLMFLVDVSSVSSRWLLSGRQNCHIFHNESCHHSWWVVALFCQFENGGSVEIRFDVPHCLVSNGMRGALHVCDMCVAKE